MFAVNVFPAFNYFLALLFHSARPNRAFDVVSSIDNLQRNIPQSQEWNMLILILVIQSFFKSRTKLRGQVKRRSISCLNGWEKSYISKFGLSSKCLFSRLARMCKESWTIFTFRYYPIDHNAMTRLNPLFFLSL